MAPPQTSPQSLHSNSFPHASATAVLAGKPTFIVWEKLRFLLMDAPRDSNLPQYLREAKHHNVTALVRVCEPTYSTAEVEAAGIQMFDMAYDDGSSPPQEVIDRWLTLVDEVFIKPPRRSSLSGALSFSNGIGNGATSNAHAPPSRDSSSSSLPGTAASPSEPHHSPPQQQQQLPPPTIAVHCVAGLGRAPVLVALALIEHGFGDPSAVVEFIRAQRRGAINMRQLNYLEQYQKRGVGTCGGCCVM